MIFTMDSLSTSAEKYDGNFPYFRQPTKVGEFSLDEGRHFHHDNSQKKYISWPLNVSLEDGQSTDVHFDLNLLLGQTVRKDSELDERLDNLLKWILESKSKFKVQDEKIPFQSLSTNFVCYRGLITKLMTTPYENREPWIICASKWRGTIYLCAFDTDQKVAERQRETPRQKAMSSWGYKFEQFMMTETPGVAPNPRTPVIESEEFCCVLRSRLGHHSLVYGAEVDGVDQQQSGGPASMASFVELKTSREVETSRQRTSLQRFKMLKWWAQSFLVGIERVVVGFRDDDGTVHRLHAYSTKQLPKQQSFWSPAVCMNFADAFLGWTATQLDGVDDRRAVWRLEFEPARRRVSCRPLGRSDRYRLLPDWYTEQLFCPDPS